MPPSDTIDDDIPLKRLQRVRYGLVWLCTCRWIASFLRDRCKSQVTLLRQVFYTAVIFPPNVESGLVFSRGLPLDRCFCHPRCRFSWHSLHSDTACLPIYTPTTVTSIQQSQLMMTVALPFSLMRCISDMTMSRN
jgi:hypothetical protein